MQTCLYDAQNECLTDCRNCIRYKLKCSSCYESQKSLYQYNNNLLCIDCIISLYSKDFYDDFIDEYKSLFVEFVQDNLGLYLIP